MPGEADEIVGLAGDQAAREAFDRALDARRVGARPLDLRGQRRIDRHVAIAGELEEALGEVGVIGGKRGIDLARGDRRIERARDGAVGERHRVVLLGQQLVRLEAAREDGQRGDRQGHGQAERQCDPRPGHPVLSSSRPP